MSGTLATLSPKVKVALSFPAPGKSLSGLAWDGAAFWHHDGTQGSARTLYRLDSNGNALMKVDCPDGCCDTEFDGRHVWQAAPHHKQILVIDPSNGAVVRRVNVNGQTSGLAFDGASYWRGDWERPEIIRFHPETGMELEVIPTLTTTSGIAYDGQYFWHGGEIDGQQYLIKVDPDGAPAEKFELDFAAHGVTFDGNDLWVADGTNHRIAQLRVELTHHFGASE